MAARRLSNPLPYTRDLCDSSIGTPLYRFQGGHTPAQWKASLTRRFCSSSKQKRTCDADKHDRGLDREDREALSGGDSRFVLAVRGRVGDQRRQRPAPDTEGPRHGAERRCPESGLLHHSDQGCTYASEDYQRMLDAHGITCSMSRRGDCHDNAVMESFFSSLKTETADRFASCGEAKMELFDYIEVFYNQRRRHSTLGQISPAAFERRQNEEGVDPMENRTARGFPQAPHPSSLSIERRQDHEDRSTREPVH